MACRYVTVFTEAVMADNVGSKVTYFLVGLGVGALMMYETRAAGAEGAGGRRAERQEATENTGPPASRQACR